MKTTSATQHRIDLIATRTAEIHAEEAKTGTWDGELLGRLYALRQAHIVEALELGVTPGYISAITGLGR